MAIVGIDLGTTFSVVATMDHGNVTVINNMETKQTTPSVVFFNSSPPSLDDVCVGEAAVNSIATDPTRAVRGIKQCMGTDFKVRIGETEFTPEQISSVILKKLKADAEEYFGQEPVTDAVITVPAYFGPQEREATRKAAEMAGLQVRALLPEPVAAAIDFAQTNREDLAGKTVLVYDLGGGTFDVTVMRVSRAPGKDGAGALEFRVLGKDGSIKLGGLQWDQKLADHVGAEFARVHPGKNPCDDPISYERLLLDCQRAKEALSSKKEAKGTFAIACTHDGVTHCVEVSREKLEELTQSLLDETANKTSMLLESESLKKEGVTWSSLDVILLAGGSTKMPCVSAMLERIAGKKPRTNQGVDLNVGRGAAYLAFSPDAWVDKTGLDEPMPPAPDADPSAPIKTIRGTVAEHGPRKKVALVADVANHSVGVEAYDPIERKDVNVIIIPKNTPVNDPREERFHTHEDNQTGIELRIYKGEDRDLSAPGVELLGQVQIEGLPPRPRGQEVRVRLCYNGNGLISGEGWDVATGKKVSIEVTLEAKRQELADTHA
jgi:molecular chaperone DnaK